MKRTLSIGFIAISLISVLGACQTASPSLRFGIYSEAGKFYEKKEYRKAIVKYDEYVRNNPDGNMAIICRYYMAKSYEALGETDKARELYEKIVKEGSDQIWIDFAKARLKEIKAS